VAILVALLLGLVEGLTEFLPVSSTGHMILLGRVLPSMRHQEAFLVVIQVGAIAAVAWQERARFAAMLRPAAPGAFGGARAWLLLAAVTAPAALAGLALSGRVRVFLDPASNAGAIAVAIALAAGGVGLLALERLRGDRGTKDVDRLTVAAALGVGCFQCLALWPGVSRSAATIAGAMLLGLSRRAATELSFLAAVPILVAASAYAIAKDPGVLAGESGVALAVGFVVSAASALLAVRAFTAFVKRHTMEPFAWYRLALAAAVAAVVAMG